MKKWFILLLFISLLSQAYAQEAKYYFHNENHPQHDGVKIMDYTQPTSSSSYYIDLDEGAAIWATLPFDKEMKINGDVKVTIFIEAFFISPDVLPVQVRVIKVYLVDIAPSGNIDVIDASRPTPIFFFGNETMKSQTFSFNNVEYLIPAGHCLGVKVEKAVDLFSYFPFSILSPFFATYVLYDSIYTISFVSVPFNITGEGISIECFDNEKEVKPGNSITYTLLIYNNGNAKEEVELTTNYAGNDWKVEINPTKVKIPPNSFNYSDVKVTAPENATEGDYLNITIYATGKTGSDSIWLNTTIMPPQYGVKVTVKDREVEAKPGETAEFIFTVKNTGDLEDTYNLFVSCAWNYSLEKEQITLNAGESEDVKVFVKVPDDATNGTTQLVALTAKSVNSDKESTVDAKIKVIYVAPTEEEGGNLKMVAYILFIILVIALLGVAAYLSIIAQKFVILGCDEKLLEVPPGKTAEFSIRVRNPLEKKEKNRMKYRFRIEGKLPEDWKADMDKEEMILNGGEEGEIKVRVKVPEKASLEDWASINLVAMPQKGKSEKIDLLVTLREPKEILNVSYENEPEEPKEGERVITKVKIENVGEKDAENKKVILLVNGREKNRIEGINIPVGAIAEIEIPWIAEEENEVEVKVE